MWTMPLDCFGRGGGWREPDLRGAAEEEEDGRDGEGEGKEGSFIFLGGLRGERGGGGRGQNDTKHKEE